ncbi:MAG TPA: hypothetical protein VGL77_10405 [Armatimonadota bacterium]
MPSKQASFFWPEKRFVLCTPALGARWPQTGDSGAMALFQTVPLTRA